MAMDRVAQVSRIWIILFSADCLSFCYKKIKSRFYSDFDCNTYTLADNSGNIISCLPYPALPALVTQSSYPTLFTMAVTDTAVVSLCFFCVGIHMKYYQLAGSRHQTPPQSGLQLHAANLLSASFSCDVAEALHSPGLSCDFQVIHSCKPPHLTPTHFLWSTKSCHICPTLPPPPSK